MSALTLNSLVPDTAILATGVKNSLTLADFREKYVVLYFYPKDNTPGCIQEGQAFRDNIKQFTVLNAVILGVSRDSVRSHEGFKSKQQFPFELLSDSDETLCRLFDVIKMKNMYGKHVQGIVRSTFLISPNGIIIHEWRKVNIKTHIDDVLQVLSAYVAQSAH